MLEAFSTTPQGLWNWRHSVLHLRGCGTGGTLYYTSVAVDHVITPPHTQHKQFQYYTYNPCIHTEEIDSVPHYIFSIYSLTIPPMMSTNEKLKVRLDTHTHNVIYKFKVKTIQ